MDQPQEISKKISQLVEEAQGGTMLGVRLGASLRIYFPNFNPYQYRCRNLRHFIRTYVPSVSEKGRSGADILYAIADVEAQSALSFVPSIPRGSLIQDSRESEYVRLPTSAYIWKAYSNPSHPFIVAGNRETGMLQLLPENAPVAEPLIVLPKPTAEFHCEIAKEFTSSLSEPLRTSLGALLHDPKWYVRFSSVATRNGVGPKWGTVRRAKLIERFNSSMRDLGIPPVTSFARVPHSLGRPATQRPLPQPKADSEESVFRALVSKVVSDLPLGELRSLKLPVGAVFDALKR